MSEPLSDKQLDKIRKELAKHRRWGRAAICCHCGESWPCTSQSYTGLLAEVDRLRNVLAESDQLWDEGWNDAMISVNPETDPKLRLLWVIEHPPADNPYRAEVRT